MIGQDLRVAKSLLNSLAPKNPGLLAILTIAYFISTRFGVKLALVQPYATPIWLPAGGAIAALLVLGYGVWPAILIGSFLGHVTTLGFVSTSFIIPIGATLEGLAGAYLVNRFAHGVKAFDSAKDVFLFVLFACICAPSVNATAGIATNYLTGRSDFMDSTLVVLTWWLSHGVGVLVIAPFLILLFRASHHRMNLLEFAELIILLLSLIFLCLLLFGPLSLSLNKNQVVRAWLCVPFLIWAGFRFCPLEAAGTTLILFGSATWGTLHGYGSFMSSSRALSLALLDSFVGVIGTMTLVVAAVVVERRRIEEDLLGTQSLLQAVVEGKDRELAVTVEALNVEAAGHANTKRTLRDHQEQLKPLLENMKFEERVREVKIHTERAE